ncbi:hydantoinase/oxoprolinase family protein [Bacillus licheniformis]|nr:hydantoinase/oxoprolinase family protein [Bacillus licheniformis]
MPSVAMYSIGAGGGSVAWIDSGGLLKVGPESVGSDPGPACYGKEQRPHLQMRFLYVII